ncbi:MAG: hypothetical protein ACRCUE_19965 [Bosea sp. (in: a-proteobacteria)]
MVRQLVFGFIAGALAVLVFHQGMVLVLHLAGQAPRFPWSIAPIAPWAVPTIVNQMFWGGLWGVGFAFIGSRIPLGGDLVRGAIFGLLGPWLLGNGILVPLFKGGTYLWGFNPQNMWRGALIGAAFGLGIAVFMRVFRGR